MSITMLSKYEPLTISAIAERSPAIFAATKHGSRSEKYNFISTETMLNSMIAEKFHPFSISQARSRSEERRGFAKHAICFRHEASFGDMKNDIVPQVVILNSHDGTTCYKIYCGFFRFVCSNGLIVGNTLSALNVYHKGVKNTMDEVIDASFKVLNQSKQMMDVIDAWKGVELSKEQRMELAYQVHDLKFAGKDTPIKAEQFLTVHNRDDYANENSLWNTYNILQENLIKGGLVGWKDGRSSQKYERRKVTTRAITNIQQNVKFNTELWNMAENMYALAA